LAECRAPPRPRPRAAGGKAPPEALDFRLPLR
jgi:hypothetical protein